MLVLWVRVAAWWVWVLHDLCWGGGNVMGSGGCVWVMVIREYAYSWQGFGVVGDGVVGL